ncbi:MAG: isopenicillin N synthase family oxygenase [Rhodospirillales bacterium]|nr:isopenicillin N synthase family oxygenase [Rhodospirillales bacterium]
MLPIIDISPLNSDDLAVRQDVARQIGQNCETMGFLYVTGHGVSDDVIADARSATKRFFAMPDETKRRFVRPEGVLRGYIPTMPFSQNTPEAPPTTYEGFNMGVELPPGDPAIEESHGLCTPNIWPDEPEDFRGAIQAYWQGVDRVSNLLLKAFALALGQDEDRFTRMFTKQLTNISLLHYHSRPELQDAPPDASVAHRDTNAITVLLPSPVGGLQVEGTDGVYREVVPEPGCFVVNIGNMMESWSGGRMRSTMHRVHPPRHLERYSIGYFAVPDYDTVVEPLPGLPVTGAPEDMAPRHAGQDLEGFISNFDRQVRELNTEAA